MRRTTLKALFVSLTLGSAAGHGQSLASGTMPPEWPGLEQAVESGDLARAKEITAAAPRLLANEGARHWLLVRAAREGHPEVVQWLLRKGADPIMLRNGESALGAAMEWDRRTREERDRAFPEYARWQEEVRSALRAGKSAALLASQKPKIAGDLEMFRGYFAPLSPEMIARKTRIILLLSPTSPGRLPPEMTRSDALLVDAIAAGFGAEVIKRLVSAGVPLTDPVGDGLPASSPLHAAVASTNPEAAAALLEFGADIERLCANPQVAKAGMQLASDLTPLMQAAMFGQEEMARLLLDHGAKVETMNREQGRAMHFAAAFGHAGFVRLLLQRGARLKVLDRWRCTPLHRVAAKGQLDAVKVLLEAGASLEPADEAGFTPLLSAIEGDHLETVEHLLAHGASRRARTDLGKGPLRVAATSNALRTARFLLERKEPVEGDTPGLNTPLIEATSSGHPAMVALLLEHGASPEARDRVQRATPLIWTVLSRPATYAQLQLGALPKSSYIKVRTKDALFLEVTRLLAAHKADLDATDRLGNTALHHAAYYGDREAVELLLSLGASRDRRNARQLTPHETAAQRGHAEIAAILQR